MLIKIKDGDSTLQFDSTKQAIAILFTPKDKEAVEKMAPDDLLIVSAPFQVMSDKASEVWQWAMTGWKGAKWVDPRSTQTQTQLEQLRKF